MGRIMAGHTSGTPMTATACDLSLTAILRIRSLSVLVLAGAVLALSAGCVKTTITEDDVESKQRQIREATEKFLGGPIPADEQRG